MDGWMTAYLVMHVDNVGGIHKPAGAALGHLEETLGKQIGHPGSNTARSASRNPGSKGTETEKETEEREPRAFALLIKLRVRSRGDKAKERHSTRDRL